jgi:hypothetical protein
MTLSLEQISLFLGILVAICTLLDMRLKRIEKKLDEHNGYAKMFSEVKSDIAELRTDVKWLRGRKNEESN